MLTATKCYTLAICLGLFAVVAAGQDTGTGADPAAALATFQERLGSYAEARARIVAGLPELPAKATPEQIEAHKTAFQKAVMASRRRARHGDIINSDAAATIRAAIAAAYVGEDRKRLRQTVFVAENKTVPVRANSPYPEAAEILEMPPVLLATLPQLPKELQWRFVANNLLVMDKDLLLIVDYLTNALP